MTRPMSRTRASLLLGPFALLWFGYPIVFYTWYFTADRVVATVEGCTKQERTCPGHGTWTMTDGSRGSGQIFGSDTGDVGKPVRVRATRSWALLDGVVGTWPAMLAAGSIVADVAGAVLILRVRRRDRRRRPAP